MTLSLSIKQALASAEDFASCESTALEFELSLLDLGFYNIEFYPPAAAFDGIRYDLSPISRQTPTRRLTPLRQRLTLVQEELGL